jgi:Flp pilus assembly protein TadG
MKLSTASPSACGTLTRNRAPGNFRLVARNRQRGTSNVMAVIWLLILGTFVFVCIKVVPVLYSEYQFQDAMQTTARFATISRQSAEQIKKTMTEEAEKQEIDVAPEDIHVTTEAGNVKISADYTVMIDLQFYQLTLNLHPNASNNRL